MKEVYSKSGEHLFRLMQVNSSMLSKPVQFAQYTILLVASGKGIFHADFGSFAFEGPILLFSTPLQIIYLEHDEVSAVNLLQFHGDFYCIEYHKAEVACNGLLFNNIYISPYIRLSETEGQVFNRLFNEFEEELAEEIPSETVLRAYLQLFLAKSSNIKSKSIKNRDDLGKKDMQMEHFMELLDKHYLTLRKPLDYAELLSMSPGYFSKRCTRYFNKTPSHLIQERLILEAKKQLHLTRQSIKEIAYSLKFQDEFYFSRVFKKVTKVSPQTFRDKTGISIVADLSNA
jgi:AraC family transcriptional regulator, transcriptional activator of pobA